MFDIRRYTPDNAAEWNRFVKESKNGTFLFDRNYMDYHSDRFKDCSFMVYRRGKLYALFPANIDGNTWKSHGGLTYGGMLINEKASASDIIAIFRQLNIYLHNISIDKVVYKPVPWIYHRQPSEEDLYAIFNACGARLVSKAISSVVYKEKRNKWHRIRECGRKKAEKDGIFIERNSSPDAFWNILTENLRKCHDTKPVHTVDEIRLLMQRFPENIHLYTAVKGETILGGTLLYITDRVVHSQYISASEEGKSLHALDLLFYYVMEKSLTGHVFFDFGISTEDNGRYLNESLIYQKEGFGARAVCYDTYEWDIK